MGFVNKKMWGYEDEIEEREDGFYREYSLLFPTADECLVVSEDDCAYVWEKKYLHKGEQMDI